VHAPHVRCLEIDGSMDAAPCLSACAAASRLQTLRVSFSTPVSSAAWLSALTALRTLRLGNFSHYQPLHLPPGFSQLIALEDVHLEGCPLVFEGARLPSSLTRLHICDFGSTQMPHQMRRLLASTCCLHACTASALLPLPACRCLTLQGLLPLPACRGLTV
jgi:hypothetical protein